MGQSEDYIYEIFEALEKRKIKKEFFNQLEKMKWQQKHRYKTPKYMSTLIIKLVKNQISFKLCQKIKT